MEAVRGMVWIFSGIAHCFGLKCKHQTMAELKCSIYSVLTIVDRGNLNAYPSEIKTIMV